MKIVVCVNPTTGAAVDVADATIRAGSTPVSALREPDAHAVEQALRIAEVRAVSEIVVVSLAPAEALGSVREALALGATRAVLLDDAGVRHLDLGALAPVLAALLASEPADLYLACSSSGDIDGLLMWNAVGQLLGLPVVTQAAGLEVGDGSIRATRQSERGDQVVTAPTPCLIEVAPTINQARYPTLKGRAAAQNKRIDLVTPAQLGIDTDHLVPRTSVLGVSQATRSRSPVVVTDQTTAAEQIVDFLRQRRLV